jgi:hypothetical protein
MSATPAALCAPPCLDHVFVVVSAETLAAISACQFLRAETLGRFTIQESHSTLIGHYAPARIFGRNTFIELFPDRFGEGEFAEISCGLVVSFGQVGDHVAARQRLAAAELPFQAELLLRRYGPDNGLRPWYHSTRPAVGGPLALFMSEVTPEYRAHLGAPVGPDGRLSRSAYLAASADRAEPVEGLMQDIDSVVLRIAPRRAARVAQALASMGYDRTDDGPSIRLAGPDVDVWLTPVPAGAPEGVCEVWLRLRAAQPPRRFDFGPGASLELSPSGSDDARAVWRIEPRPVG